MLNMRKLKKDFSSNMLAEGKEIFDGNKVVNAKIVALDASTIKVNAKVLGQYDNTYECHLEIDRDECETVDSDCDCPYHYDCQHLAALLFYLEQHLDSMLIAFSRETDLEEYQEDDQEDEESRKELLEVVKEAANKEEKKRQKQYERELLREYISSSKVLSESPFFLAPPSKAVDSAELVVIFHIPKKGKHVKSHIDVQLALRLPNRSKPLHLTQLPEFLAAFKNEESIFINGKEYLFTKESFSEKSQQMCVKLLDALNVHEPTAKDKNQRVGYLNKDMFGSVLAMAYREAFQDQLKRHHSFQDQLQFALSGFYIEGFDQPLMAGFHPAEFHVTIEYIEPPASKLLLNPKLQIDEEALHIEEVLMFHCSAPALLSQGVYYRFPEAITRTHLTEFKKLRELTIPEPLFGTFIENSIPEIAKYAVVENASLLNQFTTLPFVESVQGVCELSYLDGELEATLSFMYGECFVPSVHDKVQLSHLNHFVSESGIIARNLVEEKAIADEIFRDFIFDSVSKTYISKSEKKIIEFMTDIVPRYKSNVEFKCPQNLLDQFIYDQSKFDIVVEHTERLDTYSLTLKVDGMLSGVKMDRLWECILSKRAFLELEWGKKRKKTNQSKMPKILVLNLDVIGKVAQLFDELGIDVIKNSTVERPIWSLSNINAESFTGLPVSFTMSEQLTAIRQQMLGEKPITFSGIPKSVQATPRQYQVEGIQWLERLRSMYLNGILADDMGLGKTLQAITAIGQLYTSKKTALAPSLIVCPTSLLYNWKEEFQRFLPSVKVEVIDGIPTQRKKQIESIDQINVAVTSYSLLQKDIEHYEATTFTYSILDEAQHIKNRGTRNAKSVKQIRAVHRLILSGTPIENSLDELWSLFDYLMPGFLNTYDRFVEKYIRVGKEIQQERLEYLRNKASPFILRRMKEDVLNDLPPVSEISYRCQLTASQNELYKSYAASARDELTKLVERDGFDKVQIHVLATLTRLKQICCHPAIFAKESPQLGDSAKYEMLIDLIQTLIDGNHKTVIFSQYTKMLHIMRDDFQKMGIRFVYLDGSSKNRLEIVKQFNEDPMVSIFLVSLKAGGTGLNLVGADTVIHYDMWWNPAVENQATDRVHRLGQTKKVSVYKLITLNTIEEKIVKMQERKRGLVKKVVSSDEEAISKLTWEEVLELLQSE